MTATAAKTDPKPEAPAEAPPAKVAEDPNALSPFADYEIRTLNPDYAGESLGVKFQAGYARIYGLASTSTPQEQEAQLAKLLWFRNSGERSYLVDEVIDQDTGETKRTLRRGPVYKLTRWAGR